MQIDPIYSNMENKNEALNLTHSLNKSNKISTKRILRIWDHSYNSSSVNMQTKNNNKIRRENEEKNIVHIGSWPINLFYLTYLNKRKMFRAQGSYPQSSYSLTLPEQPPLLSVYTIHVHKHSAAPKSQKFIHFISSPIDTFSLSAFHLPRTRSAAQNLSKMGKRKHAKGRVCP